MTNDNQPLKGVKVIDLTYFVAGPGTARILADMGADVIKVEPSWGDPGRLTGQSLMMPVIDEESNPFYTTYNANKRGISLDLKSSKGLEILDKLLSTADVFVTSYRTKALVKLGLDYDTIHKKYPQIVWGQINGFGDFGPAKNNPGFDTVAFWARSGAMSDNAERGTTVNPAIGFGDASTACSLAAGICGALYQQAKTGVGKKVMVSLYGQAIWAMSALIPAAQFGDEYPKTRKNAVSPVINSYKCSDEKWIFLSILEHERYIDTLLKMLNREDLIGNEKFSTTLAAKENGPELISILDEEFRKYTQDEADKMLTENDIAHEKIQTALDISKDLQAIENNYVVPFENRNGTKTYLSMPPVKYNTVDCIEIKDAPLVGQHNYEVLEELGFSIEEIDKLSEDGIIFNEKIK